MHTLAVAALIAVIVQGVLGGHDGVASCCPGGFLPPMPALPSSFSPPPWPWRCSRRVPWLKLVPAAISGATPEYPLRGAAPRRADRAWWVSSSSAQPPGTKRLATIYHISGAPLVATVVFWVSMRILLHYARNRELVFGAVTLMSITLVQIFLGIAAFMTRIAYADAVQPMPLMVTFTVLHVAVGALTLATSVDPGDSGSPQSGARAAMPSMTAHAISARS